MVDIEAFLSRIKAAKTHDEHDAIIAEMASIGETAIPDLITAIHRKERPYQFTKALVRIGQASTLPLLEVFLHDVFNDSAVQWTIVDALKQLKDARVVEPLLQVIKAGDELRSPEAVRILQSMGDARIVPAMIGILSDTTTSDKARTSAITLLGRLHAIEAIELIAPYLNNADLRFTASFALHRLGDERSIAPMLSILSDEPYISPARLEATYLAKIRPHEKLFPILLKNLQNIIASGLEIWRENKLDYHDYAELLVEALEHSKADEVVLALMDVVYHGDPTPDTALKAIVAIGTDFAIDQLISQLGRPFGYWDEWGMGRKGVIEAVASLGEKAVPRLIAIVKNRNAPSRSGAFEILCLIGGEQVVDLIIELLNDPQYDGLVMNSQIADKLKHLNGKRLLQPIIASLRRDTMHQNVARIIAEMASIDELILMLQDDHYAVRDAAIHALKINPDKQATQYVLPLLPVHGFSVAELLAKLGGTQAMEALIRQLDKTAHAGEFAVQAGGQSAIPLLLERLKEDNDKVQLSAAMGLAKWGDQNHADAVFAAFEAMTNPQNRLAMLDSLAELQDKRAIQPLVGCVYGEPENHRGYAMRALGFFRLPEATYAVRDILMSLPTYRDNRDLANTALDILRREDTVNFGALLECLQHPDPLVKARILFQLPISFDTEKAVAAVTPLLKDTTWVPNWRFNNKEVRVCDLAAYILSKHKIVYANHIDGGYIDLS